MISNQHQFSYNVLICTYNGAYFIKQQLESILKQSIQPQEIIISDDGSTDNTLTIVEQVFRDWKFESYKIIHSSRKSAMANFLYSLEYATADYIFLADQDDIWCDDKVTVFSQLQAVKKAQSFAKNTPLLAFSDAQLIDENNQEIHPSFFEYQGLNAKCFEDDSILYKACVQGAACMINRPLQQLILASLQYVEIKNLYMHDWWIALLAKYYGDAIYIDSPLIQYRQHSKNQIGTFNHKWRFVHYLLKAKLYILNFKQAIKQAKALETFIFGYHKPLNTEFRTAKLRQYSQVPILKRIILRIFSL